MVAANQARAQPQVERAPLAGLIFVVVLLLALISLPPLASARAESLRGRLDGEVQTFQAALDASEDGMQEMQAAARAYVLTQEPAFLEQYRTAAASLPERLQILAFLARHAGQVLTHAQILQEVWGEGYGGENQYLWVHMARLRQKLEPNARSGSREMLPPPRPLRTTQASFPRRWLKPFKRPVRDAVSQRSILGDAPACGSSGEEALGFLLGLRLRTRATRYGDYAIL